MKTLKKAHFLKAFQPHEITLDTRYHPPQTLLFATKPDISWSWEIPASAKQLPRFITALFEACEEEKGYYLYPRGRTFTGAQYPASFQVEAIFALCGLSPGADEVVYATTDQMDAIESLFAISLIFGGTVDDDLFVIPSHGKLILYADHHEAIHCASSCPELLERVKERIKNFR